MPGVDWGPMGSGLLVAVEGPSAAGKTTLTEAAGAGTSWNVLTEAYRRVVPSLSLEFGSPEELLALERTLLREEVRRYREAADLAHGGATVVADTGFLGPLTYTAALVAGGRAPAPVLATLLHEARGLGERGEWGLADAYVYLDTPPELRASRARADPAGAPPELAARHREMGELERAFYLEHFARLWGPNFRVVAGDRPVPELVATLTRAVADLHAAPESTVRLDDVLGLLADAGTPTSPRGNR